MARLKAREAVAPPTSSEALEAFAAERGLPVEYLLQHGIHVVQEGEREGWLAIPWRTWMGHEWYVRHRNMWGGNPKYLDQSGADLHLYNPRGAGPHTPLVFICEGELDAITLCFLGYEAVAMSGADKFAHHYFQDIVPLLFTGAKVVIAVDNDQAGQTAMAAISKAIPSAQVLHVPEEHGKDIGDWWLADPESLEKALEAFRV